KECGVIKKFFEQLFSGRLGLSLEKFLKKIQLKIMPHRLRELAVAQPKDVVLGDGVLKFHDKDTRVEIRDQWQETVCHITA
ncbi:MAG: hypothetical protein WC654_08475, partial [Patescibacteria group bacterium]